MINPKKIVGLIVFLAVLFCVGLSYSGVFYATIRFSLDPSVEWMGNTREKVVALTFDDGPDRVYTRQILAVLKRYRVSATFFVTGMNARKYPDLIRAEFSAGHLVGNHTHTHPHLQQLSEADILNELQMTDQTIASASGEKTFLFRPPYEELNENILNVSRKLHKKVVMSTVTLEHHRLKTPKEEAERVVERVYPGAIILAHDGRLNRIRTVEALPYLIKGLTAKGYRIIPLNKLLF
jgi:peptidoglycan/xylan/chitin deacetylase (PgdA/CDA1 family)